MKRVIFVLITLVLTTLTGCASSSLETLEDENLPGIVFFEHRTEIDVAGGPRTVHTGAAEVKGGESRILYRDTHAAPGTLQTIIPSVVAGYAGYRAAKDRAPHVVNGDSTTIFDVDGGDAAASANAETETDVDINTDTNEEDVSYEMSDEHE